MSFAMFFTPCKFERAEHLFVYRQSGAHKGVLFVPLPVSFVEESSICGLASLITSCGSDPL